MYFNHYYKQIIQISVNDVIYMHQKRIAVHKTDQPDAVVLGTVMIIRGKNET